MKLRLQLLAPVRPVLPVRIPVAMVLALVAWGCGPTGGSEPIAGATGSDDGQPTVGLSTGVVSTSDSTSGSGAVDTTGSSITGTTGDASPCPDGSSSRCLEGAVSACFCGEFLGVISNGARAHVHDLDADGDDDFVISSFGAGALEVTGWTNLGDGTFEPGPTASSAGASGTFVLVPALGRLVLVRDAEIEAYDFVGATFEAPVAIAPSFAGPSAVTVGDFDGDGSLDFLRKIIGPPPDFMATIILAFDVEGIPVVDEYPIDPPRFGAPSVHACDLDGDGTSELLDVDGGHVAYEATAGVAPVWIDVPPLYGWIICNDLDGDGATDVLRGAISDTSNDELFAAYNLDGMLLEPVALPGPPYGGTGTYLWYTWPARVLEGLPQLVTIGDHELFSGNSIFGALSQPRARRYGPEGGLLVEGVSEHMLGAIDADGDGLDELLTAHRSTEAADQPTELVLYRGSGH